MHADSVVDILAPAERADSLKVPDALSTVRCAVTSTSVKGAQRIRDWRNAASEVEWPYDQYSDCKDPQVVETWGEGVARARVDDEN